MAPAILGKGAGPAAIEELIEGARGRLARVRDLRVKRQGESWLPLPLRYQYQHSFTASAKACTLAGSPWKKWSEGAMM